MRTNGKMRKRSTKSFQVMMVVLKLNRRKRHLAVNITFVAAKSNVPTQFVRVSSTPVVCVMTKNGINALIINAITNSTATTSKTLSVSAVEKSNQKGKHAKNAKRTSAHTIAKFVLFMTITMSKKVFTTVISVEYAEWAEEKIHSIVTRVKLVLT